MHLFCLLVLALGRIVHPPGCSCSSVCQDALYPVPSPSARVLVEAFLPPACTCPDLSVSKLGCSCSSVWKDALYPAPCQDKRKLHPRVLWRSCRRQHI